MLNYATNNQSATVLQHFFQKIKHSSARLSHWRKGRFSLALRRIEHVFLDINGTGKAGYRHCYNATREFLRIYLYHPDFYFLAGGMALMVFATRSFTEPGVEYGPWRPVVVALAAILAGAIPLVVSAALFPIHIKYRMNTWGLTVLNIVISANIFAFVEPIIPTFFYSTGVLHYQDLIFGILVFYALALGYLHLQLRKHISLNRYIDRHKTNSIFAILPADARGDVVALTAQDHYVEIITENGRHLVRMTMKKAIEMLPENAGIQVHRSHWVAFPAILNLEKTGSRYALLLRSGEKFPVGKAGVSEVQAFLEKR